MTHIKKNLSRFLFVLGLLLVSMNSGNAQAQLKIGYTNPEVILAQMPAFRAIQDSLRALAIQSQAEVDVKIRDFQTKVEDYQEKAALLAEATRATREQELVELDQAVRQFQSQKEQELMQTEATLLQPLLDQVQTAINATAEEMELDFVMVNEVSAGPVLLYVRDPQWDITEAVMQKLNIAPRENPGN